MRAANGLEPRAGVSSYAKVWGTTPIDSSSFGSQRYANPSDWPVTSAEVDMEEGAATLGGVSLPQELISGLAK